MSNVKKFKITHFTDWLKEYTIYLKLKVGEKMKRGRKGKYKIYNNKVIVPN